MEAHKGQPAGAGSRDGAQGLPTWCGAIIEVALREGKASLTARLVEGQWGKELIEAVRLDSSDLRINCPFLKVGPLERLLRRHPGTGGIGS